MPQNLKPDIDTVLMPTANTEYSYAFPKGCKKIEMKLRSLTVLFRMQFISGKVATSVEPFFTVDPGLSYWDDFIESESSEFTAYFAAPSVSMVMEIKYWY